MYGSGATFAASSSTQERGGVNLCPGTRSLIRLAALTTWSASIVVTEATAPSLSGEMTQRTSLEERNDSTSKDSSFGGVRASRTESIMIGSSAPCIVPTKPDIVSLAISTMRSVSVETIILAVGEPTERRISTASSGWETHRWTAVMS